MTRFSRQMADEIPARNSDSAQRRTKPADVGPASPRKIERLYAEGRERPNLKADAKIQKPQFSEDTHGKGYDNDTKGWVRGQGPIEGGLHPQFDHGRFDINNVPPKARGPANKASGADCNRSPFSSAYRKGSGEGF